MNAKLLTTAEVATLTGLKEPTIRSYRTRGTFPSPDQMFGITPVWKLSTIQTWMRTPRPVGRPKGSTKPKPPAPSWRYQKATQ